ncbi:MAG: hypothetical protein NTZ50_00005, partial [Chloroflexi bacterium]|nr:hypothetical protein [Chloroflexota bacterium]
MRRYLPTSPMSSESDSAIAEASANLLDPERLVQYFIDPMALALYETAFRSDLALESDSSVSAAEAEKSITDMLAGLAYDAKRLSKVLNLTFASYITTATKYSSYFAVGVIVLVGVLTTVGGVYGDALSVVTGFSHAIGVTMSAMRIVKMYEIGADKVFKSNELTVFFLGAENAQKLAENMPEFFLVVQVGITWGLAFVEMAMSDVAFGSAAFFDIVASAAASTITAVIMYAIFLIPAIGPVIQSVIYIIDGVIFAVCWALDEADVTNRKGVAFGESDFGRRFCQGISGLLKEFIKNFIYSRRSLVGNLNSDDRLQFPNLGDMFTLVDPNVGTVVGADASVRLDVENTIQLNTVYHSAEEIDAAIVPLGIDPLAIPWLWQYNTENLKKSEFVYALQLENKQTDLHEDLELGSSAGDWESVEGGSTPRFKIERSAQITSREILVQTGVNRELPVGLAEGQAVPAQQCFPVPILPYSMCSIVADKTTTYLPLGSVLRYDVLPTTFDSFVATTPTSNTAGGADGGYTLTWAKDGDLPFARQKDADGDGLRNIVDGGNDPNDSRWDSDGDGMSDYVELQLGTDPVLADTDNDGVPDRVEIVNGTDPRLADTDGDGLTDKQEIDGWEFVYDITDAGQLRSWVTSDPLSIDGDGDGITDVLEKTYGFNPRVASELKVLTYASQVKEVAAPALLWRMDAAADAQAFADSSGHNAGGTCASASTCPATGISGVYGNAARFDGGDAIVSTAPFELANVSWTVALWAKRDTAGNDDFAFGAGTQGQNSLLQIGFGSSNTFVCDFGGNAVQTTAYSDTNWHHWACTYDAVSRQRKIYRDGVQAAADAPSAPFGSGGDWHIGGLPTPGKNFNGLLDEFAVFDRALNGTEVTRQRDGNYSADDLVVAPGDALTYEGTVGNELLNRYANGLLTTQMAGGLSSDIAPQAFVLQPQETKTLYGTVSVAANAATGLYELTQAAEASIQDRREQSGFAEAWLKFDEGAGTTTYADYSGVVPARTATCSGNACPTAGVAGVTGNAATFDGSNDSLSISPAAIVGQYTVAAWVRPNHQSNTLAVLGSRGPTDYGFEMKFMAGNLITAQIGDGARWLTSDARMNFSYATGQWYHVAYVVSTSGWTGYVNGVARASGSFNATPVLVDSSHALRIGQSGKNTTYWKGEIDDLRMYNRSLAGPEVAMLAARPVLNLSFDSGGTFRPTDLSPAANVVTCETSNSYQYWDGYYRTGSGYCPVLTTGILGKGFRSTALSYPRSENIDGFDMDERHWYDIASSTSLNFNDGNLTLIMWINPTDGADSAYNAAPQGLIGNNSGDANSMPSLQRVGRKLRFGFGASDGWRETTTLNDVLTVGAWQQVAATFDGTTVYFFVNGVQVGSSVDLAGRKPNALNYKLLLGRSDNTWNLDLKDVYIRQEGDPGSSSSEGTLLVREADGTKRYFCYDEGWDEGETHKWGNQCPNQFGAVHAWAPGVGIELWEEDEGDNDTQDPRDDTMIVRRFWGDEPNGNYSQEGTGLTDVRFDYAVSGQNAVPFAGSIDEVLAYKSAFSADLVMAQYLATRTGILLRLDEPAGSSEFRDDTGFYKLNCVSPNCPGAVVSGRIG